MEGNKNYPLLLLTLLEKSQDNVIRVCAAVTFKNYIKRNWRIVSFIKLQQVVHVDSALLSILYVFLVRSVKRTIVVSVLACALHLLSYFCDMFS